jgi:hypothetical protein
MFIKLMTIPWVRCATIGGVWTGKVDSNAGSIGIGLISENLLFNLG